MLPLVFEPLIKQIRWGGRRLGSVLHKPIGDAADYAESWEIADQPDGRSVVASGLDKGTTLQQLIQNSGQELLGRHSNLAQFPLLIKFLDANDWLSLQVHPNDEQAGRYLTDGNGKTESWIILDAEPDSQICAGLKSGVNQSDFEACLRAGQIEETLHMIPAQAGDCLHIPAQTVHALGPGILLAEIQQQSNLTFRLHDWGRVGTDGKPRELHIEQSLQCIDFERGPVNPVVPVELSNGQHNFEELVRCEYFVIRRHRTVNQFCIPVDDRFRILMVLNGSGKILTDKGSINAPHGQTVLIPASSGELTIIPDQQMTLLEVLKP